jgi:lipoprotein-anchoring transpeptidase ErfK/SrfK
MGHSSIFASETTGFVTVALSAGIGAAMLMAVAPANAFTFDTRQSMSPYGFAPNSQRLAYRSRDTKDTKEKPTKETEELVSKAKGPMSVFVSLDKQHLTLYSGDTPIAHTKVSTGTASHPTPTGVFSVIQKDRWHRSNIYGNAPMFYMQRITWSGVAMHQGHVTGQPASHGCIRLPEAFAKQLWVLTGMGARVIVSRGELSPSAFSNPKLFVFKEPPPPPQPELNEPAETVGQSTDPVKSAFNAVEQADPSKTNTKARSTASDVAKVDPAIAVATKPLKPGPIAVFVSRKEGKIFVRKGFEQILEVPVAIAQPDQPLGTHVFTALAMNDDKSTMRWSLVTVPTTTAIGTRKSDRTRIEKGKKVEVAAPGPITTTAAEALNRVTIPQEALDRIQALMSVGASLTISDQGLGPETGKGTDFIVLTR